MRIKPERKERRTEKVRKRRLRPGLVDRRVEAASPWTPASAAAAAGGGGASSEISAIVVGGHRERRNKANAPLDQIPFKVDLGLG